MVKKKKLELTSHQDLPIVGYILRRRGTDELGWPILIVVVIGAAVGAYGLYFRKS